ncbi:MAG: UDP-N-acetylmuramoyl-tripeptide--D-alanyl-D-alanine ligase [Clostridiales bacterium]|nr:UDP-N-acetylmuramoyl-tripeptide--D-alanyl-D-alanine ligase [Clostridiales bacterium]
METLFYTLPILVISAVMVLQAMGCSRRFFHLLQLDSYQLDGYAKSVVRSAKKDRDTLLLLCTGVWFAALFLPLLEDAAAGLGTAVLCVMAVVLWLKCNQLKKQQAEAKAKKEFVETARMQRLLKTFRILVWVWAVIISIAAIAALLLLGVTMRPLAAGRLYALCLLILLLPLMLLPQTVALVARIRQPLENRINQGFVDDAKAILRRRPELIRIGITGSYGKTSTKFILGAILKEKYNTLVPPSSYNTPMGITRMVREMLTEEHEVMICEMGARRVGEIKELCDIVHPQYGILTSIGPQHLETFLSIENVAGTKYELMQALPKDGIGFFAADDAYCEDLYKTHSGNKGLFGLRETGMYMGASNITAGAFGSEFDLIAPDGSTIHCTTGLLGKHNISNILGCACVAYALGLTLEEIARGIAKAEPVEHRLQLINPGNGTLVIDDAFNSNPSGARAAMDVLSMFHGFRKICITPGMVELGERQEAENYAFGKRMAEVCDIAILIGEKQSAPIRKGLLECGFPELFLFTAKNLDEATAILGHLVRPKDVILFENDLPDNYNEQ